MGIVMTDWGGGTRAFMGEAEDEGEGRMGVYGNSSRSVSSRIVGDRKWGMCICVYLCVSVSCVVWCVAYLGSGGMGKGQEGGFKRLQDGSFVSICERKPPGAEGKG